MSDGATSEEDHIQFEFEDGSGVMQLTPVTCLSAIVDHLVGAGGVTGDRTKFHAELAEILDYVLCVDNDLSFLRRWVEIRADHLTSCSDFPELENGYAIRFREVMTKFGNDMQLLIDQYDRDLTAAYEEICGNCGQEAANHSNPKHGNWCPTGNKVGSWSTTSKFQRKTSP